MEAPEADPTARRAVNLSVRADLAAAARAARLNLSMLLERALEKELLLIRRRRWREENAGAVEAYNRHVKDNGAFAQIWRRT